MKKSKIFSLITLGVFLSAQPAMALPQGASVVSGEAAFDSSGHQLTVTASDQAIINYDQFNIGSQERVHFIQPSASALVLNRVVGSDPSSILGNLSANGRVFLVNPNGVFFGTGATIDTGSLIASTLNISNDNFLNKNFVFDANGNAGSVTNEGVITADQAIALLGSDVTNNGLLVARAGTVALASGEKVTLDLTGEGFFNVALEGDAANGRVTNSGIIQANDGQVLLTARVFEDAFANVINNSGVIEASSMINDGGVIRLVSEGEGVVSHSGEIKAAGGTQGGQVDILGKYVGLFGDATITASGDQGGGTVLVGGDYQGSDPAIRNSIGTFMNKDAAIYADGRTSGNGGTVVLWSDGSTRASGLISAQGSPSGEGGLVETSGKMSLSTQDLLVFSKTWLLDPYDITISSIATVNGSFNAANPNVFTPSATGAVVDRTDIQNNLNAGTDVTVRTTGGGGGENGDIAVNATITKSAGSDATLRLNADRDVIVNNAITATNNTGKLHMMFNAGRNIALNANLISQGGLISLTAGTDIDAPSGVATLNADAYDSGANADGTSSDGISLDTILGSIGATNAINLTANGDDAGGDNAGSDGGAAGGITIDAATSSNLGTVTAIGGDATNGVGVGAANGGLGGDITGTANGAVSFGAIDLSGGDSNSTDGGDGKSAGSIIMDSGAGTISVQSITLNGGRGYINGDGGSGGLVMLDAGSTLTVNDALTSGSGLGAGSGTDGGSGDIFLTSDTNVTLNGANADITTLSNLWATADNDNDGTGTYTQNHAGSAVVAGSSVTIAAADVNLIGTINTAAGDTDFQMSQNLGTIGLGDTAGTMTISGAELQNVTAANVNIGFVVNGNITVDNITAANSNNIGTVYLRASHADTSILFVNNASTFNALSAQATDGIDVNVSVTADTGSLVFDGNSDAGTDTLDNIDLAGGVTLTSATLMGLSATTGGILLSGANGSTVTLDANGDVLMTLSQIKDTNNVNLTANSEGSITLSGGASNLGTGNYTFTADNDNDSADGINVDAAITGNSTLTLSGGGTGTNDDLDADADITANALTIQNFNTVDLAASVDFTTNNGALDVGSTNVANLNLSGANGTTNIIDGNGDAAVTLTGLRDTNNPNLTVTSEGDLTLLGATNLGTGTYSFTTDNDNDGTGAFVSLGEITGSAATTIFSGGGIGVNDTLQLVADLTTGPMTIQNFSSVNWMGDVDVTTSGALSASSNIGVINLSGSDGTTNIITSTGDAAVSFAPLTDTNNPDFFVFSDGNITLYGGINLGIGNYSFTADYDNDSTSTLALDGSFTGSALFIFTGGGGVGNTTDTLDVNADISAGDIAMQVFNTVDLAGSVDLTATAGDISIFVTGINLSGANGTTNVLSQTGGTILLLSSLTDTNNVNLTANAEEGLYLDGLTNLGTGTYSFTADSDNDDIGLLQSDGAITGNSTIVFSGGGTGTSDVFDLNADVTARVLTIQNFASVDLAQSVDLVANLGALTASSNVTAINLSGANGTTNVIDGNNDAAVSLGAITDTNNVNLTVTSEGSLTMAGITNAGSGIYSLTADNDDDSTATFALNGAISGSSSLTLSGGGSGTNDDLDVNADITAASLTIGNFASVDLAASVDLTASTAAVTANSNVTAINLSGANGTTNTIDAGTNINLGPLTDSNNVHLTATADGNFTLAGATSLGTGTYSLTADANDDSTSTFTINGAITGSSALTLSGGGTGTSDDLDINADITAASLTIQNFASVDLAGGVDLTSAGAMAASSNVSAINLSGASGTTNTITGAGDSAVSLGVLTDTNNVDLTVASEGNLTLAGATNLGSGDYTFTVDSDNDGSRSFTISGLISGISMLTLAGTGSNDTLTVNADVMADTITTQTFSSVTLASGASLTSSNSSNLVITDTVDSGDDVTATAAGSILDDNDGQGVDVDSVNDATLTAMTGVVGTAQNPLEVEVGGQLFISAGGQVGNISAVINGTTSDGFVHLLNDAPGVVIFNSRVVAGNDAATINDNIGQASSGMELPVDLGTGPGLNLSANDFQMNYSPDFLHVEPSAN